MAATTFADLNALLDACPVTVTDVIGYLGVAGATVDFRTLVEAISPTQAVINGDGSITITPPGGAPVIFGPFDPSIITDNLDGTYTHDDGTGATTIIDTNQNPSSMTDNGNGLYTHVAGDGAVQIINTNQFASTILNNADGTYLHTNGLGATQIIDTVTAHTPSSVVDNLDGTYTHTDGDGNAVTINTVTATTTSVVTNNADGTYTHQDGDGNSVVIDVCDSLQYCSLGDIGNVSAVAPAIGQNLSWDGAQWLPVTPSTSALVDNADGTYTHTSGSGAVQGIDTQATSNPYTPANTTNWSIPFPTTVHEALEELSDRPEMTVSTAASNVFPGSPQQGQVHTWISPTGADCGMMSWIRKDGAWVQTSNFVQRQPITVVTAPFNGVFHNFQAVAPTLLDGDLIDAVVSISITKPSTDCGDSNVVVLHEINHLPMVAYEYIGDTEDFLLGVQLQSRQSINAGAFGAWTDLAHHRINFRSGDGVHVQQLDTPFRIERILNMVPGDTHTYEMRALLISPDPVHANKRFTIGANTYRMSAKV